MRRSLVTGGAGVIGQRLVAQLVERGDHVRVIDRLARPLGMDPGVDYTQADIVDVGENLITSFDPEVVFHLAAAFERSEENPSFWLENAHDNVAASSAVLAGSVRAPSLRRYVFASSYLIYDPDLYLSDEPPTAPVDLREDGPINPRNACGAAKLLHEKEIELATHDSATNFTAVAARIYRVYGRSSRDIVSRWVRAAIAGEKLSVYGEESLFDYVLADDVAEGLFRLAEVDATGIVNLASGSSRSVRDLVACLQSHFPNLEIDGPHPAPVYEASQASLQRLVSEIDWQPGSSLEFGVSQIVAHERENVAAHTVSARVLPPRRASIMISSLSGKSSLARAARRSLNALNVEGILWGADAVASPLARPLVDDFWHMPKLSDLADSEIVDFCVRNDIRVLIPTRDGELVRYAALRDELATVGTFVPIGTVESVELSIDKLRFAELMVSAGLPVIPTALRPVETSVGRLVVKARFGAGSGALHLDVDAEQAFALTNGGSDAVVQPMIHGDEYSIDVYIRRDGSVVGAVPRRRTEVRGGESTVTTTEDNPELVDLAISAALALGVRGHAVVQAIVSESGPLLLEVNARVGGASAAAFTAGLRSIDAMILEALGDRPSNALPRPGVTMTRTNSDRFDWA